MDRTEKVKNCQDPEFSKRLCIDYHFEKVQKLKLGIYDIDNKSVDLKDDDYLGGFECNLGQVLALSHGTCCEALSYTWCSILKLLFVHKCVWWNVCSLHVLIFFKDCVK